MHELGERIFVVVVLNKDNIGVGVARSVLVFGWLPGEDGGVLLLPILFLEGFYLFVLVVEVLLLVLDSHLHRIVVVDRAGVLLVGGQLDFAAVAPFAPAHSHLHALQRTHLVVFRLVFDRLHSFVLEGSFIQRHVCHALYLNVLLLSRAVQLSEQFPFPHVCSCSVVLLFQSNNVRLSLVDIPEQGFAVKLVLLVGLPVGEDCAWELVLASPKGGRLFAFPDVELPVVLLLQIAFLV